MGNKLATAHALAARGFPVFPIKTGAKFPPHVKGWPEKATTDSDQIAAWWSRWPEANIGIHCAGLVVLDVDVRSGGLAALAQIQGDLPPTLTGLTPSGGKHLFYRLPEGHPGVQNGAGKLGAGIDIKSTNGYVVAPGSEVPAGRYRFEADVPIATAPDWLVQELGTSTIREQKEKVDVPDAPDDVCLRALEWLASRPVGDEAFKTACGLRDFGLSMGQTMQALAAHDGRPESDLRPKVEHAYQYAQNPPGSKAITADEFPVIEQPPRPRKKLLKLNELAMHPPSPYLIKGFLQRGSHAVLFGRPGVGKTFNALDMAYHVASGLPWHERRVHPGAVLYLAYEGIGGIAKRAAALAKKYEDADVPLYVVAADYNLRDPAGRKALSEDLSQLPEKPVLVVVDTLARAMKGGDENSAQDMGALNDAVSALIHATGACVLLIHHSGKNKANGARGSSALLGAIDTELEVDDRQVITRKQRDIELADPLGFKLVPVVIGLDPDGEEVMSCYVEPAPAIAERTAGLRGNTLLVWEVMCGIEDNKPIHGSLWQSLCSEFLPAKEAAARKSFYKAKQALIKRGLVEQLPDGHYQRRMQ